MSDRKRLSPSTFRLIAGSAIAVALIVGGGVVAMLVGGGPSKRTVAIDKAEQYPDAWARVDGKPERPPNEAITQSGKNEWSARGKTGAILIHKQGDGFHFNTFFIGGLKLPPDQAKLKRLRDQLREDQAFARQLELTRDQKAQLEKVDFSGFMLKLSDVAKERMERLWANYLKTPPGAARDEVGRILLDFIDSEATLGWEREHRVIEEKTGQIRKILSPTQLQRVLQP